MGFSLKVVLLLAGALAGYALLLRTNPVRRSLLDGWRASMRYPSLWLIPLAFGVTYELFHLGVRAHLYFLLPPADRPLLMWSRAPYAPGWEWWLGRPESLWHLPSGAGRAALQAGLLPGLEGVAGVFHNIVTTFPLAALAALLLLVNRRGHLLVVARALQRRLRWAGWIVFGFVIICALAVIAKVLLYFFPAAIDPMIYLYWSPVVAWLAFVFEYLFGGCIQVYLILLAYSWVRGLVFPRERLLDFAIRRFSVVLRWMLLGLLLSTLAIDLPLMLQNVPAFASWFSAEPVELERRTVLARAILSAFFVLFASVQITLAFHTESLRRALADHGRLVRRHWWQLGWLIIVGFVHFFLLAAGGRLLEEGFGEGTALWAVARVAGRAAAGLCAGWLLASWVALYRSWDAPAKEGKLVQGVLF